jgi:type II secretory pathway component PulF
MVQAGESGGKLAEALEMSAIYLEKQADLKRRVKAAFAYPLVVSIVAFLVVGLLLIFVVPIFSKLYKQLHVVLPGPTQTLVDCSFLIRDWWWAILIVATGVGVLLYQLLRSPNVRARWDAFKLSMPFFYKLNRMIVMSHFTRAFAMLASVGISLIDALDVASVVAQNHKVAEISKELQQAIEGGNSVGSSLKKYDIVPPILIHFAVSGEEVGKLPEMLNKAVDFLDKDIDRTINALLVKLEPVLTVIIGFIIGFILMGVYLPMFDYMQHLE